MVMDALGEGLMLGVDAGVGEHMMNGDSHPFTRQKNNYAVDRIMSADENVTLSLWSSLDQASATAKTASLDKDYPNIPVGVFQGNQLLQGYVNGALKTRQQIQAIIGNEEIL